MSTLDKYLKLACEGKTGEKCDYCGSRNSRRGETCSKCRARMQPPILFCFGVPVYDERDAYKLLGTGKPWVIVNEEGEKAK